MKQKPKLKPCPFCGGTVQDIHKAYGSESWPLMEYEVSCGRCFATVSVCLDLNDVMTQAAMEKWNHRTDAEHKEWEENTQ